jgi:hypothetical protein
MWELQPLSNNRRTTEISLLLGENTSLTISQNTSQLCGITFPLSLSSSLLFLTWCDFMARMHCLFIGKHPCLCLAKDKARQVAPIGAASGTELVPILLT